jgi:Na+/H+-translocating membrane pyrophosphatase
MDIIGNTLSAIVKGYSSGSAGLISFGIYGAVMLSANVKFLYHDFHILLIIRFLL